ncbi:MAG TPA: hypothetical protein VLI04_14870 [Nocardioidaceae bacterium]|nr:hypothetical protein [Nocardioidaceae bacterium]
MKTSDTHWTLGVLVGWPVTLVIVAGFASAAYALFRRSKALKANSSYADHRLPLVFGWAAAATAVFIFGAVALSSFPYGAQYHQWRPVSGTVASIDSRLVAGSSAADEKFVVTFEGGRQQYGCSDTRCAGIDVGDDLSLSCIRKWEWAAVGGYDCRYVDYSPH